MMRHLGMAFWLVLAGLQMGWLGGCRAAAPMNVPGEFQPMPAQGMNFGEFEQTPKPRLGCLPYPGPLTLFEVADPKHLGHHAYDQQTGEGEVERGIVYTLRGGFIDIAHTRKVMDLTKHVAVRAQFALGNGWTAFQVKSLEPSIFTVRLHYPAFWGSLPAAEKAQLAQELSYRIAERTAMLMVTWHEVLTWFGYQSTPIISEWPSAFTWDDTGAHAFGISVADKALRDPRRWDDAVTDALNAGLAELKPVTPEQCVAAINQIQDAWWSGGDPLKRQVEVGWDGQPIDAWLVPNLPFGDSISPHRYYLPQLADVRGRNFSGLLDIRIDPRVGDADKVLDILPERPQQIAVDRDLPRIIDHIRQWHLSHDGPLALSPRVENPYLAGRH